MIGFPDGTFMPNGLITRAETAALLVRTMTTHFGVNVPRTQADSIAGRFSDVSVGAWYSDYIAIAYSYGLIQGFPDGSFRPNQYITNAEFAAFATNFFNLRQFAPRADFADQFDHLAKEFIAYSFDLLWFDYFGQDYVFKADAPIPRSVAVTLVNHYAGRVPDLVQVQRFLQGHMLYNDITAYNHWAFYEIMIASITHDFTRDENNLPIWDIQDNWWLVKNQRLLGNWWFL